MQNTRLTGNDLERMLQQAVELLNGRSVMLEQATAMSKKQINEEIDRRIDRINSKKLDEGDLKQLKAETQTLAVILLRRG
jgi:hypothetical protein